MGLAERSRRSREPRPMKTLSGRMVSLLLASDSVISFRVAASIVESMCWMWFPESITIIFSVANSFQHFPTFRPLCKNSLFKTYYVVQKSVKIPDFLYLHMEKCRTQNTLRIRPLFGPFWENPAKIRPQICPAAYIFIRPLLSFAAEESASWEHWLY